MSTDPTVPPPPDVPPVALEPDSRTGYTRAAAMWTALILWFLGVAILFAAVAGGLITVAVGAVRMFQLRRAAKHNLTVGH